MLESLPGGIEKSLYMPTHQHDERQPDEMTVPSRPGMAALPAEDSPHTIASRASGTGAPWLIEQHQYGRINIYEELTIRYPSLPLLTIIKTRESRSPSQPTLMVMSAPDGMAGLVAEVKPNTRQLQLAFTYGSVMTMRFVFDELNANVCIDWLDMLRRPQDGTAFLFTEARWEKDYLITVVRKKFACIYGFSRNGFEAAMRMTDEVKNHFHDALRRAWSLEDGELTPKVPLW